MGDDQIETVGAWLRAARSIVVLTGAGASTESGIPDFRGPDGVWTRDPDAERYASIDAYLGSHDVRVRAWQWRMASPAWGAAPNAAHVALAALEQAGKLELLITQNIDGLHQRAGSSPDRVVEMHGSMRAIVCVDCGERSSTDDAFARVRAGEDDPPCRSCGGVLKTTTVFFGQPLDPGNLARAEQAARRCDVLVAIGTSLQVYPVAALPQVALRSGARLVIVNGEPTPYDATASAVLRGRIGTVVPALVQRALMD